MPYSITTIDPIYHEISVNHLPYYVTNTWTAQCIAMFSTVYKLSLIQSCVTVLYETIYAHDMSCVAWKS